MWPTRTGGSFHRGWWAQQDIAAVWESSSCMKKLRPKNRASSTPEDVRSGQKLPALRNLRSRGLCRGLNLIVRAHTNIANPAGRPGGLMRFGFFVLSFFSIRVHFHSQLRTFPALLSCPSVFSSFHPILFCAHNFSDLIAHVHIYSTYTSNQVDWCPRLR